MNDAKFIEGFSLGMAVIALCALGDQIGFAILRGLGLF
jgi:hypothetical protein